MKFALFYTHCETLGHTTRMRRLVDGLMQAGHEVLVVCSGKAQPEYEPHSRIIRGEIKYTRDSFADITPEKADVSFIKETLAFNPDIFITEHFPFGREKHAKELTALIRLLKEEKCKIVSSLGYPTYSTPIRRLKEHLQHFDLVLVHAPEEEFYYIAQAYKSYGLSHAKEWEKHIAEHVVYTGYITEPIIPDTTYDVVISRGGGSVYTSFLAKAAKAVGEKSLVVGGPSTTDEDHTLFTKICDIPSYLRHDPQLDSKIAGSQVSVSMVGYNTSVQLLYHKKDCVLVPFRRGSMHSIEQYGRANMLKAYLGAQILDMACSTEDIQEAITQSRGTPKKDIPSSWFLGLDTTIRLLTSLHQS